MHIDALAYRRAALGGLSLLAAMASACGGAPEETEETSQPLRSVREVITHVHQHGRPVKRYLAITCLGGATDCAEPQEMLLMRNSTDTEPFTATATGGYQGCGPQLVANIMGYVLDYQIAVGDVREQNGRGWVDTWQFSKGAIATTPNELKTGIELGLNVDYHQYKLVHGKAPGFFESVAGRKGKRLEELKNWLRTGFPLVLLVNRGNHFQMVTGYRAPDLFHVVDYRWRHDGSQWQKIEGSYDPRDGSTLGGQWKRFSELGFYDLDVKSTFARGFQGFVEQTYMAIESVRNNSPF